MPAQRGDLTIDQYKNLARTPCGDIDNYPKEQQIIEEWRLPPCREQCYCDIWAKEMDCYCTIYREISTYGPCVA